MNFQPTHTAPMEPKHLVGVAIRKTQNTGMHVGLVYTHSSGEIKFAHLAWHNDLRDEPAPNHEPYLWADCEWLADPEAASLAELVTTFVEMCTQIKHIPYGQRPPVRAFNENGRYVSTDAREGLTCATFVAAVLEGAGFPVVDLNSWQSRPDDETWWSGLTGIMQRRPDTAARAVDLKDIPVEYRLRPDEVAVATAAVRVPLSFGEASVQALSLNALLFSPPPPLPANDLIDATLAPSPTGSAN